MRECCHITTTQSIARSTAATKLSIASFLYVSLPALTQVIDPAIQHERQYAQKATFTTKRGCHTCPQCSALQCSRAPEHAQRHQKLIEPALGDSRPGFIANVTTRRRAQRATCVSEKRRSIQPKSAMTKISTQTHIEVHLHVYIAVPRTSGSLNTRCKGSTYNTRSKVQNLFTLFDQKAFNSASNHDNRLAGAIVDLLGSLNHGASKG